VVGAAVCECAAEAFDEFAEFHGFFLASNGTDQN
jgi:hypothetical protein